MNITTRTGRWLAAAAVGCCAMLLPGMALAATSGPAHAAPRVTVPGCETPGLVIWLDTDGGGTAGSVYYNLEFTNLSGHTCTLNGFPFINAVSLNGSLLGRRAGITGGPAHQVTLNQGQTATAALQIVNVLDFSASRCKPVTAQTAGPFRPLRLSQAGHLKAGHGAEERPEPPTERAAPA